MACNTCGTTRKHGREISSCRQASVWGVVQCTDILYLQEDGQITDRKTKYRLHIMLRTDPSPNPLGGGGAAFLFFLPIFMKMFWAYCSFLFRRDVAVLSLWCIDRVGYVNYSTTPEEAVQTYADSLQSSDLCFCQQNFNMLIFYIFFNIRAPTCTKLNLSHMEETNPR